MSTSKGSKAGPNHNAVLARNGHTMRDCVSRILTVFDRATAADIESGARWYGEDAQAIVSEVAAHGQVSRECAATVIAHLSPRTTWQRNVAGAFAAVRGEQMPGIMITNYSRAEAALRVWESGGDPLDTLKGPKTRAFALNLLGDRTAITVDVWAARVALNPHWSRGDDDQSELVLGRAGMYAAIAHAYRLSADKRGVDGTTMQATAWIVIRNGRAG